MNPNNLLDFKIYKRKFGYFPSKKGNLIESRASIY